ncbi:unnamed protein product [Withania somnifera]
MVRTAFIDKNGIKRGAWSEDEDNKLRTFVERFGHPNWRQLPKYAGLMRCGKSCRLRWMNYLRPGLKKGNYSREEEQLIIELHKKLGNRWSTIAEKLGGRSDNDVKNYWHAHLKKHAILTKTKSDSAGSQNEQSSKFSEYEAGCEIKELPIISTMVDLVSTSFPLEVDLSNEMDWIEEDNYMRSMEQFSSINSLEPFDNFWSEPLFDNFWTQPFI